MDDFKWRLSWYAATFLVVPTLLSLLLLSLRKSFIGLSLGLGWCFHLYLWRVFLLVGLCVVTFGRTQMKMPLKIYLNRHRFILSC